MRSLDDAQKIYDLDRSDMLRHVIDMPLHCVMARHGVWDLSLKMKASTIHSVLISGVGGSAIGGEALASYLSPTAQFPIVINRRYDLPAWVSKNTLVVCSSYSGNTEETLSVFKQALSRRCPILIVTSGGALLHLAQKKNLPFVQMPTGMQPRATLGYSFMALLTVLEKLKLVPSREKDFRETVALLERQSRQLGADIPEAKNEAKKLARFFYQKTPAIYAGQDYFESVAYRWKCQFNENAKQLAWMNVVSEMNHNEVSGFTLEEKFNRQMAVVLLRSGQHDHHRIGQRFDLLKNILEAKTGGVREIWAEGNSILAQMLSTVHLGDFVTVYLAALKDLDPTPIDLIESFKTKLGRLKR
jgi:glucose/mannose-6-phosphate isomerase